MTKSGRGRVENKYTYSNYPSNPYLGACDIVLYDFDSNGLYDHAGVATGGAIVCTHTTAYKNVTWTLFDNMNLADRVKCSWAILKT